MSDEKQVIAQNISLLLSQNRAAEARAELDRLLAMDGEDPESRSLAGDVYAWTGAHGAAYKNYNLAADIFNRLGRADQALGVHHKILDLDTSMLDAATQARIRLLTLLVSAEDALVSGQHEKAVAGYTEAIRQFPNHTITYQRLATLLVRLGRHAEAVQQYLTVGRAFYGHGVLPKARPYFERVLELQPDQSEALEAVLRCLDVEDKAAEGGRFLKAAVQASLEQGAIENAAAWFERLPEEGRDGATPMGAALLLQSGELSQADRMVGQLDLQKLEVTDWFKHMGRAALNRGDSLSADVFFRWSSGKAQEEAASSASPPETVAEVPAPEPVLEAPAPAAVPAAAAPLLPPPGLGAPAPPPPGLGVPVPPPPVPAAAAPEVAPSSPVAAPVAEASPQTPDDKAILQTMGEMCLAEEMFEEAKQVFERLTRADPSVRSYWELLNRARTGLGLSPVSIPSLQPPVAPLPVPSPPVAAKVEAAPVPEPVLEAAPAPAPEPVVEFEAVPAPVPKPVTPVEPEVEPVAAVLTPPPALVPPPLRAFTPAPPPPLPSLPVPETQQPALPGLLPPPVFAGRPELEPVGRRSHTPAKPESGVERPAVEWGDSPFAVGPGSAAEKPSKPLPPPVPAPALAAGAAPAPVSRLLPSEAPKAAVAATFAPSATYLSQIQRHAFTVQLGELPPAVASAADAQDEIIE